MELSTVKDAFDHVVKKQKLSSSKSQEVIDQVSHEIEQSLTKIQSVDDIAFPNDPKSVLTDLKFKLNGIGLQNLLDGPQKELNSNFSKYFKLLDKVFNPNISKAYISVDWDHHILNQIIASHLYRLGFFDLGDCLVNEAGEPEASVLRSEFLEMYQILEAMRVKNIKPALNWVSANREKLKQNATDLELKLHRLQFVEILQKRGQDDALIYARTHLASLASIHLDEIQKLMGSLLWAGKLERSPYADLMIPTHWDNLTEELSRQFCSLLGQSYQSPLTVAIGAGFEGLPTLLKLENVMAAKKQEWQAMKQLPVPLELGKEFQFHSTFVCPVSRDQGSDENPPMLMPCHHVLCKQSIIALPKSSAKILKCPYCLGDALVAECRQLYF